MLLQLCGRRWRCRLLPGSQGAPTEMKPFAVGQSQRQSSEVVSQEEWAMSFHGALNLQTTLATFSSFDHGNRIILALQRRALKERWSECPVQVTSHTSHQGQIQDEVTSHTSQSGWQEGHPDSGQLLVHTGCTVNALSPYLTQLRTKSVDMCPCQDFSSGKFNFRFCPFLRRHSY